MGFIRFSAYAGGVDTPLKFLLAIAVVAGFGAAGYFLLKGEDHNLSIMAPKEFGILIDGKKVEPRRRMAGYCTYDLHLSGGTHRITVKAASKDDFQMDYQPVKTGGKLRFGLDSSGRIGLLD